MIAVLQPSFWQRTVIGLVVVLVVATPAAHLMGWFARTVLEPRAAGRRWPEGAYWLRLVAEPLVDLQRRSAGPPPDSRGVATGCRAGLSLAGYAVIPVSTGLVVTQPGLGLFVLPVVSGADALAIWVATSPWERGIDALATRVGTAVVLGLMGGVVAAQWGTASFAHLMVSQGHTSIFGVAGWGLPTALVHPVAFGVAVVALHCANVGIASTQAATRGGAVGFVAGLIDQSWLLLGAAWLVGAFLGGGTVPWGIANDGVRHAVAVVVFSAKWTVVALGFAWARATWPDVSVRAVRWLLAVGAVVGVVGIAATVGIRHLL